MTQITAHYNLNIQAQKQLENDVFTFIANKYHQSPKIKDKYDLTQVDILSNQDLHVIVRLEPKTDKGKGYIPSFFSHYSELKDEPILTESEEDGYLIAYNEDFNTKVLFIYYTVERNHDSNIEE